MGKFIGNTIFHSITISSINLTDTPHTRIMEANMDITREVIPEEVIVMEETTMVVMAITNMEVTQRIGTPLIMEVIMESMEDMLTGDMTRPLGWSRSGTKTRPGETNQTMLLMEVTMDLTTLATRRTIMDPLDTDPMVHPIMEMTTTTSTGIMVDMDHRRAD